MKNRVLISAHRAGNDVKTTRAALGHADMIELDLHVRKGKVEVGHEKILWPTSRLWERWHLLPKDYRREPIEHILEVLKPDTVLHLDLKCFTRRAGRIIKKSIPDTHEMVVTGRTWWVLGVFKDRVKSFRLRACVSGFWLRLALLLPGLGEDQGIVIHQKLLIKANVDKILKQTPHLYAWAVGDGNRARELANWGVTGLIADDYKKINRSLTIGK